MLNHGAIHSISVCRCTPALAQSRRWGNPDRAGDEHAVVDPADPRRAFTARHRHPGDDGANPDALTAPGAIVARRSNLRAR